MKKRVVTQGGVLFGWVLVALLYAQHVHAQTKTFRDVVCDAVQLMTPIAALLLGIALLVFIWGIVKFIAKAGDENERAKGKQVMVWGIVAFFVVLSLWGIVELIETSIFGSDVPGIGSSFTGDDCGL